MSSSRVIEVKIVGSADQLAATFGKAAAAAEGFGAKMESVGKRITSTGKTLSRNVTLPLVAIGAVAIKSAVDFQSSMELIHTQAGVSQKAVDQMSKSVLGMAASVGTTPQTLSEGMFHLASQGLRGAKAMDALKIAAEGAKVGQAGLEDVTNALGAVLVSGIKGAENMGQAMGALNAVVGAGDMHMQDLADALGTGLPAKAAVFGVSLRDAGAALAVFGDNNIRGADAGTLFNSTLRVMGAESKAAAKVLGTIGLGQTQLANDMRSPGGLVAALTDLKKHMTDAGLSASQQASLLTRAFGGRQAGGVLILIDQLERLKLKEKEVAAGAGGFDAAWAATQKTAQFKFDQIKAQLATVAVNLGAQLLPVALRLGQFVSRVAQGFSNLSPATQSFIEKLAGIGIVLGPGLNMVGRLVSSFGTLYRLMGAIGKVGGGGAGLGSAITIGVVGLTAGFLYLSSRENDFQRANDNLRHSLELLGGDLNRTASLVQHLGDVESRLPTDKLAVRTAELAYQEQRVAVAHDAHGAAMLRLVAAYQKGNISETELVSRAQRIRGATLGEQQDFANLIQTIDGLRVARRTEASDAGQAAALKKAVANSEAKTWKDLANVRRDVANTSATALAQEASAIRQRWGPAAQQMGETIQQLAASSPKLAQALRAGPVLAAKDLADALSRDAAAAEKTNPKVAGMTTKLAEFVRVTGRVPKKVEVNYILDPKHANESLASIMSHLNAHITTAGRLAMTGGDKIASGFFAAGGKVQRAVQSTMVKAEGAVTHAAGPAHGAGVTTGAAAGQGVADGIGSKLGAIVAAAVSTVRTAMAQAGAMAHGSGPWQFTIHEVGKPLMEGVAEGVRQSVGMLALAMSGHLREAVQEAQLTSAVGHILGFGVATSIADGLRGKQQTVHQQIVSTMQAALADRGEIAEAARVLGKHQAQLVADGVLGYQPTLAQQLRTALKDAMKQAMDAAKQQVDSSMSNLISSFSNLKSQILSAFDAINSAGASTGNFAGSASTRKEAAAVDAEQKAADAQALAEQRAQLADAIAKARTQRKQDADSGASQDQLNQDDQAIAAAIQAQTDFEQQQKIKADQEQLAKDQQRDKNNLEKRLAKLQSEIKAHPERAKQIRVEIDNLLKQFGITPGALTQASDFDTAASLFTSGMGDLKKSMDALTSATDKLADLQAGASTSSSGKMPHAADGGIFQPVPGGLIRIVEDGHEEAVIPLDPARRQRAHQLMSTVSSIVGFANGGIPSFANGTSGVNDGKGAGGYDTPAYRASAIWQNDWGQDKFQRAIGTALSGTIGNKAMYAAAMRATTVNTGSGTWQLHRGQLKGDPFTGVAGQLVKQWQTMYPGMVIEPLSGTNIGGVAAMTRLPMNGQELGPLLRGASTGVQSAMETLAKITSFGMHWEGQAPPTPMKFDPTKLAPRPDDGSASTVAPIDPGEKRFGNGGIVRAIAALADGGIVTGPTLALIGEKGDEAVLPLTSGRGRSMLAGGGTSHFTFAPTISIGGEGLDDPDRQRKVARKIADLAYSELQRHQIRNARQKL